MQAKGTATSTHAFNTFWDIARKSVTGVFGIVTDGFGNVTGHFGDVTEGSFSAS